MHIQRAVEQEPAVAVHWATEIAPDGYCYVNFAHQQVVRYPSMFGSAHICLTDLSEKGTPVES